MTTEDLIVQRPAKPKQLVLLFHGVGSSARDLAPLGEALAPHLPDAAIVSVQAPEASGRGWQWFSVQGVTVATLPLPGASYTSCSLRLRTSARTSTRLAPMANGSTPRTWNGGSGIRCLNSIRLRPESLRFEP